MFDVEKERRLRQSPIFQLSLASKELFHSNLLYWLAQNYKENFFNLLEKLLEGKNNHLKEWKEVFLSKEQEKDEYEIEVTREKDNFDLGVWKKERAKYSRKTGDKKKGDLRIDAEGYPVYNYTPLLILENKVKSVISNDQLNRYKVKVKKKLKTDPKDLDFILLSLAEVPEEIKNQDEWKVVYYKQLKEALESCFVYVEEPKLKINNQSLPYLIIKDYCEYIGLLHDLTQKWNTNHELFKVDHQAKSLRLDDIRQKILFANAVNAIIEELKSEFAFLRGVSNKEFEELLKQEGQNSEKTSNEDITRIEEMLIAEGNSTPATALPLLFIGQGYDHATGLFDIKFYPKRSSSIHHNLIQVQDQYIRYVISYNKEKKKESKKEEEREKEIRDLKAAWIDIEPECENMKVGYFGPNFIYCKSKLDIAETISDITAKVKEILLKAKEFGIENLDDLRKIVGKK